MTVFLTNWLMFALALVALALQVWALFHCLRTKPAQFERAGKRTKGFWSGMTVAATVVGALYSLAPGLGFLFLVEMGAVTASCVYLADVRPAVAPSRRGGNRNMGPYGPW